MASIKYGNSAFEKLMIRKSKSIRAEVRKEARQTGRDMADWLGIAVREWQSKPRFVGQVIMLPDYTEVRVNVAGNMKKIFFYVDQGTGLYGPKKSPYPIVPKTPGGMLKFQTGYSARSQPGAKIGMGTGERTGDWVSAKAVMHPGIKPRDFTKKVIEELNPDFYDRISDAIATGIKG